MILPGGYEISVHPFFVAQVNPNTKDKYLKKIAGYDIYCLASVDGENAILVNPIDPEDTKAYWIENFEGLKGFISDDLQDFLNVMLSGSESVVSSVNLNELINFRFMTEEDVYKMDEGIDDLIREYKLDRELIKSENY